MIRLIIVFLAALVTTSAAAEPKVVHEKDPFEPCEMVTEKASNRLYALKCADDAEVLSATWQGLFDLGTYRGAYTRFTLRGGRVLETNREPYPNVSSCRSRAGCTYFSTASVEIPFCVMFSEISLSTGLTIKASGGPEDQFINFTGKQLLNFRAGLVRANFIKEEDYPLPALGNLNLELC